MPDDRTDANVRPEPRRTPFDLAATEETESTPFRRGASPLGNVDGIVSDAVQASGGDPGFLLITGVRLLMEATKDPKMQGLRPAISRFIAQIRGTMSQAQETRTPGGAPPVERGSVPPPPFESGEQV
jgi:hypothetical protein